MPLATRGGRRRRQLGSHVAAARSATPRGGHLGRRNQAYCAPSALRRRSAASDRPRSSISLNPPSDVRRAKKVAFRNFNSSRLPEDRRVLLEDRVRREEELPRFVAMLHSAGSARAMTGHCPDHAAPCSMTRCPSASPRGWTRTFRACCPASPSPS